MDKQRVIDLLTAIRMQIMTLLAEVVRIEQELDTPNEPKLEDSEKDSPL